MIVLPTYYPHYLLLLRPPMRLAIANHLPPLLPPTDYSLLLPPTDYSLFAPSY